MTFQVCVIYYGSFCFYDCSTYDWQRFAFEIKSSSNNEIFPPAYIEIIKGEKINGYDADLKKDLLQEAEDYFNTYGRVYSLNN